ncbi:DUF2805 domain-containing protein [Prosthecobacter vanneervenii]|uniref:DUF2805 domain-containing protein n=1 Tax=Prosthecobacter vanneervenii TaxID=48466 RepID=UPI00160F69BA
MPRWLVACIRPAPALQGSGKKWPNAQTSVIFAQTACRLPRELKSSSFRCWRKRVSGRVTKHRKLLELKLKG